MSLRRWVLLTLAVILLWSAWTLSGAGLAQGATLSDSKIAPGLGQRVNDLLSRGEEDERVSLIVQTWGPPGRSEIEEVESLGGSAGKSFGSIHGFSAKIPARAVPRLALHPHVKHLSYDWRVGGHVDAAVAPAGGSAPAPAPSFSFSGRGVTVAVLDSGVMPVPEFGGNGATLITEIDVVEPDERFADPFGHGTPVAGIIAGSGAASTGPGALKFRGIAPGARIVSVKVLDGNGWGNVSDVLAGVDWAIENNEVYHIRVLNLSLGHPVDESYATDPLCRALEAAWRAGIVVVVSAGNLGGNGYASVTSPANDPWVITVGAAQDWGTPELSDDLVASFSSRGPTAIDGVIKPDILAAGTNVVSLRSPGSRLDALLPARRVKLSAYTTQLPAGDDDSPYASLSGTSMAAPLISGAAAILLEQDPRATPDDVKARLMVGAHKMNDVIVARGAGLLDLGAALALGAAGVVSPESRSPRLIPIFNADGSRGLDLQEIGTAWGDPVTWSSELVWGERAIWGLSAQWSEAAAWSGMADTGAAPPPSEGDLAVWGGP